MPQSIDVGAVLGGRYKVAALVLTSADGDFVLEGTDQVLNRPVSILVASPANASQVATSAREIATGERYGAMQVLDLGISDGSTYLVTNTANPADLLDLVIQRDGPYIEPFYTDTLGSEIFGESRSLEPHVHEDDDEYYEELRVQEETRPGILDSIPEVNLSDRVAGLAARFGKKNVPGGAVGAPAAGGQSPDGPPTGELSMVPGPTAPAEDKRPATQPKVSLWSEEPAAAPADSDPVPPPPPTRPPAPRPPTPRQAAPRQQVPLRPTPATPPAPLPPVPPASPREGGEDLASLGMGSVREDSGRTAAVFPAAARTYEQEYSESDYLEDDEYGEYGEAPEDNGGRTKRLLMGAILGMILIGAVVFAFKALSPQDQAPVAASPSASSAPADPTDSNKAEAPTSAPTAAPVVPQIAGLTRVVPGNQALNADTDGTLANAIDGNAGSMYRTFTYTQPMFGGFASNMVFVVELEELSDVTSVELSGLNGTGGAFEISIGETEDLGSAREISSGSFTGPTVTVPVPAEDGAAKAEYVFINVTELPRLASAANSSRPYGLQVAEIKVS